MSQPPHDQHPGQPEAPAGRDVTGSVLHRPQGAAADSQATQGVPGQRPAPPQPGQYPTPPATNATIALSRPAVPPQNAQAGYGQGAAAGYQQAAPRSGGPGQAQAAAAPGPGGYGQAAPAPRPAGYGQAAPGGTAAGGQGQAAVAQGGGQAGQIAAATGQGLAAGQSWSAGVVLARPGGAVATTPGAPPAPPGTVYRRGDGAPLRSRPLARLRIGTHMVNAAALEQLSVPSAGAGLVVGSDRDRQPVLIRLFRREPTTIVLVGGVWAARLLAFRALALGAQVYATTGQPAAWDGLGAHAVGQHNRVQLSTVELDRLPPANAHRPVLVIRDTGPGGSPTVLGPWQARVTVVRQLDHNAMAVLGEADLVILQRLAPDEAPLASYVLRLSPQSTQLVQMLEPDMLALMGGGANRYVWLRQTAVERQLLGAPQR